MPASTDYDVVVHGDAERRGDVDDRLGHLDIGLRWRRIAARMMHQDYCAVWLPNEAIRIRRRFSTKVTYSLE
jgi:hypothetical protein